MSDALVSTPVAAAAAAVAGTLIVVASKQIRKNTRTDLVPLMGVMAAFVFAAQMINFSIPGTGSSGHIVGGILLAAMLGPWAAFLALSSVLIVQCLIFADGGLLALGCNIINMAALSTLVGYPLIYKPIAGNSLRPWRLMTAAILSSIVALELGALCVTTETELSGITSIPPVTFISFMMPIHLAIGLIEGLATGAVLIFIAHYSPATMRPTIAADTAQPRRSYKKLLALFGVLTLLLAGGFTWLACSDPDGLEWSLGKVAGAIDFSSVQPPTAIMPEYNSTLAGIIGAAMVMLLLWAFTSLITVRLHHSSNKTAQ